jgi:hypothetical protein
MFYSREAINFKEHSLQIKMFLKIVLFIKLR